MAHYLACPRIKVASVIDMLPRNYIEGLEQNQQIASCCRHPENHDIEAFYSSEAQRDLGIPDIYINHCTCGRRHRRFCMGTGTAEKPEVRPFWEVR